MQRILLAIGEPRYSKILRDKFRQQADKFAVSDQEVLHHKYIAEVVQEEQPNILIIHDYYLQTEKTTLADKEMEWLNLIDTLRTRYDDAVRIVFLCERAKGDLFLSELVNRNVLDIFNNNSINIHQLIEQLSEKAKYANASRFKVDNTYTNPNFETGFPIEEEEPEKEVKAKREKGEPSREKKKREKKPAPEKDREQKVVNKQVVKREYQFNVTHNVERVVGIPVERKLVMIGSPFSRSGSTFISHLIAGVLVDLGIDTTYIESPYSPAYTYDRFIGHERAPNYQSKFAKFIKETATYKEKVFDWKMDNLDLIAKHPIEEPIYESSEVNFESFVKILLSTTTPVTLIDVGNDWDNEVMQEVYDMAHHVYMVLEPDISQFQYLEESLDKTTVFYQKALTEDKTTIIGNRFDEKILDNEIISGLFDNKLQAIFPNFPAKDVFDVQFKGSLLYENKRMRDMIDQEIQPILHDLLPEDFMKKRSKHNRLFKNIFNKKVSISKT